MEGIRQTQQDCQSNIEKVGDYLRVYMEQRGNYLVEDVFLGVGLENYQGLAKEVLVEVFGDQFMVPVQIEYLEEEEEEDKEDKEEEVGLIQQQKVDYSL